MKNTNKNDLFTESLHNPKKFTLTFELVPGRGAGGKRIDRLLEFARLVEKDGRITALSITDNAGGHPALAPVAIGSEIQKMGLEPMIHFSLKDKNRSQIESHLFLYQRQKFRNLLILGGDYPKPTYCGQAKPVYDLDSIQTLKLVERIKGGHYRYMEQDKDYIEPFDFRCGCVVSPFKLTEAEQVWQYAKLLKKIRSGAKFIITQLGYDLHKFKELLLFLREQGVRIPVLANVFIPSPKVAKFMAGGGVPGVVLSRELADLMQQEEKKKRLQRAAGMIATLRRLGFAGIHLGGNGLSFQDVAFVLDQAEQISAANSLSWQNIHFPVHPCWYLYKKNGSRRQLRPGKRPGMHRLQQWTHDFLFSKKTTASLLFGRFCLFCNRSRRGRKIITICERIIKEILFNCRMCGDCTLSEFTYLCSQSGCPKRLVNGPCGGSSEGKCEVFPDRPCFFVLVYGRLDKKTTLEELAQTTVLPPRDWALDQTSSWINYFAEIDHMGNNKERRGR